MDDFPLGSPLSPGARNVFIYDGADKDEGEGQIPNTACIIMMCDIILKQVCDLLKNYTDI